MLRFDFIKIEKRKNFYVAISIIGIAIFLGVISQYIPIQGILSFDFNTSVVPGWHMTIYPASILIGLIFSILTSLQILCVSFVLLSKNTNIINRKVIEYINIVLMLLSIYPSLNYLFELFISYYSGYIYEQFDFYNRVFGNFWWLYIFMILNNIILIQLFWFSKIRKSLFATLIICLFPNVSFWLERYVIYVTTLKRDYLPSSWSFSNEYSYKFLLLLIPVTFLIWFIFKISQKENS